MLLYLLKLSQIYFAQICTVKLRNYLAKYPQLCFTCQFPRKNLNDAAQQEVRLQEAFLVSWEADQEVVDLVVVQEEVGLEELKVVGQLEALKVVGQLGELKVVGQLGKRLHQEACLARWAKVVGVGLGPVYCCCS